MTDVIDRPQAVAPPSALPGSEEILTAEALGFLADLHQRFDARRRELLTAGLSGRSSSMRGICLISCRKRATSAKAIGISRQSRRPSGSAGRDHGPDQRQDGDQRAQLGRQSVHGRFRGRDVTGVGRAGPGPDQPSQPLAGQSRLHRSGDRQTLCAWGHAGRAAGPSTRLALAGTPCDG